MEFAFTDEQEALRQSAREVLADRAGPAAYRTAMDSKTGTDEALWRTIADLGWCGVAIGESDGGLGLGLIELVVLQEEMGRAIATVPFFSTVCLAGQVVQRTDEGPARAELLRAIAAGERRATLVLGHRDEGRFDAAGVKLKAERSGDGWTFSGRAAFVPEAHLADDLIVVARTERSRNPEDGLSLFRVPVGALRSKPKPQPSLDGGRRLADVRLGGVEVGADALLAGDAWPLVSRALDRAAVLLAAEAVGVASAVLDLAVAYAKEREQFGKAIGSFQAISHRCADMMVATESARSNLYYAAWALEESAPDAALAAATAKAAASDAVRLVTNDGIQVHGGIGFTWEHDMHLFYRRGKWCELYLGDAGVWRERIATHLAAAS